MMMAGMIRQLASIPMLPQPPILSRNGFRRRDLPIAGNTITGTARIARMRASNRRTSDRAGSKARRRLEDVTPGSPLNVRR